MSRSTRDQKGRRINGEIWGRNCFQVAEGKVYPDCGGEPVGGPGHKRWAKSQVSRLRRRKFLRALRFGVLADVLGDE